MMSELTCRRSRSILERSDRRILGEHHLVESADGLVTFRSALSALDLMRGEGGGWISLLHRGGIVAEGWEIG